jgi:hypothetical protein
MWNDNDIFANDIAEKFEQRMFCNFGGGGSSRDNLGGGSGTGGYDVLGTGVMDKSSYDGVRVGTDPSAVGLSLRDISGGDSGDDDYVAEIQENVDRQLAEQAIQNLQQAGLPQQIQQGFAAGTSPYAQLSARMNLNQLPNIGLLGAGLNMLGQRTASGIMERINAGGIPVYDKTGQIVGVNSPSAMGDKIGGFIEDKFGVDVPRSYAYFGRPDYDPQQGQSKAIKDKFGNVIGYEGSGAVQLGEDNDQPMRSEATSIAAVQAPDEEPSMIPMDYRYPAGGVFPSQGLFRRSSILDDAPSVYGGLLSGYDPTQFAAMQSEFERPTDVGLFVDPYDMTGYTLLS